MLAQNAPVSAHHLSLKGYSNNCTLKELMKRFLAPFIRPSTLTTNQLVILVSLHLGLFYNFAFFHGLFNVYPLSLDNTLPLISVSALFFVFNVLLLTLVSARYVIKPVLILLILLSSLAAACMDSYGIIIDDQMLVNIVSTNMKESMDLLNLRVITYFLFLGILPAIFIYKANITTSSFKASVLSRIKLSAVCLGIVIILLLLSGKFYASFFREHKTIRSYANPTYYIYSVGKFISARLAQHNATLQMIGTDAKTSTGDQDRELIILVLGETARADRFSLNGYQHETNPLLKRETVLSFTNVHSCGTSTAVSVPCIFSVHGQVGSGNEQASENLLDVLHHAGISILWRDNNSDSKGVALRVPYESFRQPDKNPVCNPECRDEGMLSGLQEYIDRHDKGDILIVLHQMGNHGPAYFKRYPKEFEKFTPVCNTSELKNCTTEQINNTYDNAILYTDYFLSKVIGLLKKNDNEFETAMIYVSDHGESLGEGGIYLHGMPKFLAPEAQTHIPAIIWFGKNYHIDSESLKGKITAEFTHDHVFHTMLGLFEVESSVYKRDMDILRADPSDMTTGPEH